MNNIGKIKEMQPYHTKSSHKSIKRQLKKTTCKSQKKKYRRLKNINLEGNLAV